MDCNYFKILYSHFNEKEVIFNIEYDIVLCTPLFYVSMYLCIFYLLVWLFLSLKFVNIKDDITSSLIIRNPKTLNTDTTYIKHCKALCFQKPVKKFFDNPRPVVAYWQMYPKVVRAGIIVIHPIGFCD